MSSISGNPKSLRALLSEGEGKNGYLIPSYQRPYSWKEDECENLWDDLYGYALPDQDDPVSFNKNGSPYFLGTMVIFPEGRPGGRLEIIDGQQRMTTITLLIRAFLTALDYGDGRPIDFIRDVKKMLWVVDNFGTIDESKLKLDSAVAMEKDWDEYREIITTGTAPLKARSNYALNYRLFLDKVKTVNATCAKDVLQRIIDYCQILPIKAEGEDCGEFALQIFSTLNDRGLPLSDSDIFKSVLFQCNNGSTDIRDEFINDWRRFEEDCRTAFWWAKGLWTDEAFAQYMYYLRARKGIVDVTTQGMRVFYRNFGKDKGARHSDFDILRDGKSFADIRELVSFWKMVASSDASLGDSVRRQLQILRYAPNRMWTYFVSVYYLSRGRGGLDEKDFADFLRKLAVYTIAFAIYRPGVNQLRKPFYREMCKMANGEAVDFAEDRLERGKIESDIRTYQFLNGRPVTKSLLVWFAFSNPNQAIPYSSEKIRYDIEHIYAKNRQKVEHGLSDEANIDAIGNKSILESTINVRVTDYAWSAKRKLYLGEWEGGHNVKTNIYDLTRLAEQPDFGEGDIVKRTDDIIDSFIGALSQECLLR